MEINLYYQTHKNDVLRKIYLIIRTEQLHNFIDIACHCKIYIA